MKEILESVMDNPDICRVTLADGCRINSGDNLPTPDNNLGAFIQIIDQDGEEIEYWDKAEWQRDPEMVMGAIMLTASGKRIALITENRVLVLKSETEVPANAFGENDETEQNCFLEFPDAEIEKIPEELKHRLVNPYPANPDRVEFEFAGYQGEHIEDVFDPLIKAGVMFCGRTYSMAFEGQLPEKFLSFNGQFASALWDEWTGDLLARFDETTGQFDSDGSTQNFIALQKQWYDFWEEFEADQDAGSGPGM